MAVFTVAKGRIARPANTTAYAAADAVGSAAVPLYCGASGQYLITKAIIRDSVVATTAAQWRLFLISGKTPANSTITDNSALQLADGDIDGTSGGHLEAVLSLDTAITTGLAQFYELDPLPVGVNIGSDMTLYAVLMVNNAYQSSANSNTIDIELTLEQAS